MALVQTIIGKHPAMKELLRRVILFAPTDVTVLIHGETGTGKELIANALQQGSLRKDHAYICINCAALSVGIVESELFGAVKGAFTGAETDKPGLFAAADGGTLFLDEINSLHSNVQAKLLRFLESGEYLPVGCVKLQHANVRIIAASNADLEAQVKRGGFREDLYFRLSVAPLKLPPLRERQDDIRLLLKHYMRLFAQKYRIKTPILGEKVYSLLQKHAWPGNVRELRNLCENLALQKIRRPIEINDLPAIYQKLSQSVSERHPRRHSHLTLPDKGVNLYELEASLIKLALARTKGNSRQASVLLGLSVEALKYRRKKLED